MGYKDKKKQLEYQRNWMRKRRSSFFKDKFCEKCGSIEDLELHHKDPNKKESHNIWSWSEKRKKAELEKCIVWCKECHVEYHMQKRSEIPITHGTYGGYKRDCRCLLCCKHHSNIMKEYHRRKR